MTQSGTRRPNWLFLTLLVVCGTATAQPAYDAEAVAAARGAFIDSMVAEHGFEREALTSLIASASIQERILEAIARPAERVVPWHEYREIFLTRSRIEGGAQFWLEHATAIDAAAERFGVDPQMLVAIIGVETLYGQRMGSYRVLDALSTLAFAYPPRARFFAAELESFLLLGREEGVEITELLGSYAGAMGAGQFIPSSFRAYAVDGDNDGRRDLWSNWQDIFASVANYFSVHGWRPGEMTAEPARRLPTFAGPEPSNALELAATVASLRDDGYEFSNSMPPESPAAVFSFERDEISNEYWIGYHNFYVITRYNRSTKYALATLQLSQQIRAEYERIRTEGPDE